MPCGLRVARTVPTENNILIIFRSSSRELAGVLSCSAQKPDLTFKP
jgi:hypothetical protein